MHASWLIRHGNVIAWVVGVVFAIGSGIVSEFWLRLRAWWAAREQRREFERAVPCRWVAGEVVTLQGHLELRGAACASLESGCNVAVSAVRGRNRAAVVRGEILVLRGAHTVLLEGPLDVLVGSKQSARGAKRGKLRLATAQRVCQVLTVDPNERLWFASLMHGDPIWVQGRLQRRSTTAATDIAWQLVPEADLIRALYRGVPRVTGAGWWRIPVAVLVAIVLYFGLAKLAYVSGAYELATATPYRTLALQRLRDRYSIAAAHDRHAVDALEIVQQLRDDYCHLESRLRELGYLERAARAGSKCGDPAERNALALCLMRRGRFADASALLEPTLNAHEKLYPGVDLAVNIHLLANQPARALSRLETLSQLDPISGTPSELVYEAKAKIECLRLALRAKFNHDPAALGALRKRLESPLAQYSCSVLYADLVEGTERLRALEACAACRSKHAMSALPWLLGVHAACAPGKEESSQCLDWLLEAKPALRHPQWDYTRPLPWIPYIIPGVESEVASYLIGAPNRPQAMTDAWTWVRDRMLVFTSATQPPLLGNLSPLLDELALARDAGKPLTAASRAKLQAVLMQWAAGRAPLDNGVPVVHKVTFEQGTCYRPRGWYERELDPRRTLASLLWTVQSVDVSTTPELAGELWITARAFATALSQRDVAVALMALHH